MMEKTEGGSKLQFRPIILFCFITVVLALNSCNGGSEKIIAESIESSTIHIVNSNFVLGQEYNFQEFEFNYPFGWPDNIHIPLNSVINNGGRITFVGDDYWEIIGFVKLSQENVADVLFDGHENEWTITKLSDGSSMYTLTNRKEWMVNGFDSSAIVYIYPSGQNIVNNSSNIHELKDICRFDIKFAKKK